MHIFLFPGKHFHTTRWSCEYIATPTGIKTSDGIYKHTSIISTQQVGFNNNLLDYIGKVDQFWDRNNQEWFLKLFSGSKIWSNFLKIEPDTIPEWCITLLRLQGYNDVPSVYSFKDVCFGSVQQAIGKWSHGTGLSYRNISLQALLCQTIYFQMITM